MGKRVFISYDRTHQQAVAVLYQDLVALGQQAWLDRSLPGGAAWWDRVVANIERCDIFVSALSGPALSSPLWTAELDLARQLGKRLLPVLVEPVSDSFVPQALGELQRIDYCAPDRASMAELMEALRSSTPTSPTTERPVTTVPPGYDFEPQAWVNSDRYLSPPDQMRLLDALERLLDDGFHRTAVLRLLKDFRGREETTATVAARIGELTDGVADEPARSGLFRLDVSDLPVEATGIDTDGTRRAFLSYSRTDRELANDLLGDIERVGWGAWIDRNLPGGEPWWNEVLEQIRTCDGVVLLASPASLSSRACQSEIEYARKLHKSLLVAEAVDEVDDAVGSQFPGARHVRYRADSKESLAELFRDLSELPAPPPLPTPLPMPPPVPATYLFDLRSSVESAAELSPIDQQKIVDQLKRYREDGHPPDELRELAIALDGRSEVTRRVSDEIAALLAGVGGVGGVGGGFGSGSRDSTRSVGAGTIGSDERTGDIDDDGGGDTAGSRSDQLPPPEVVDMPEGGGSGDASGSPDARAESAPAPRRRKRGRRFVAAAAVVLVVGAVVVGLAYAARDRADDDGGSDSDATSDVFDDSSDDPSAAGTDGVFVSVVSDIDDLELANRAYVGWRSAADSELSRALGVATVFDVDTILAEAAADAYDAATALEVEVVDATRRLAGRPTIDGTPAQGAQEWAMTHYGVWVEYGYSYAEALDGWRLTVDAMTYEQAVVAPLVVLDQQITNSFLQMCSALDRQSDPTPETARSIADICGG